MPISHRYAAPLCGLLAASLLAACGGSGNPGNPQPPGNNSANNSPSNNNPANNNPANNNPANNNPANNNPIEADPFIECGGGLLGCNGGAVCQDGVCATPPGGEAEIALHYERDSVHPVAAAPNIGCYTDPTALDDAVEYTEARGRIEKFGPGGSTQGLCVTIYNEARFFEDVMTRCETIDPTDIPALEECFEVDPCRCDAGDDACLLEIGYCGAIADSGMKAQCTQRWAYDGANASRDPQKESTLIYGHMTSIVPPEDPGNDSEGYFAIPNVPTHTRLVFKVSGRKARWIDTYEFGPILTEVRDDNGTAWSPWGGNVISIGAWNTIPSTAFVPAGIQDGNGAIAGRINDCGEAGRTIDLDGQTYTIDAPLPIANATVNLAHDGARLTYFNGNPDDTLPEPSRTTTNVLAVYAGIDVPGGPNTISNLGRLDGELVPLGTRPIFLPPRSVAIATFEGNYLPATW